jgi:shikimate kinase
MNIILIGYRCSGKTEVGKILARRLGMEFCDTDAYVERSAGKAVERVVAEEGWDHFRLEERRAVAVLAKGDRQVIATGGGVVLNEENTRKLKENGWIVWLKATPETLEGRMEADERAERLRPSLTGTDPREEIRAVLEERAPLYEKASDFAIDTTRFSPDEAVGGIVKAFEERRQNQIHGWK